MNFNSLFGERLKAERARNGHTQATLAENANISREMLGKYERGIAEPGAGVLMNLASAGVDVNFVLTGKYENKSSHAGELLSPPAKKRSHRLSGAAPAPAEDEDTIHIAVMSATGSMGPGNELLTEDVIVGEAPFSRRWLSLNIPGVQPDALRLIHAYGDSMQGTLNSGDFAVVDTSCRTVEFPGVYLLHVNRLHFIKRVSFRMDGRLVVSSDNEAERTAEVLDGSHQLDVRGRVVYGWNGRRF